MEIALLVGAAPFQLSEDAARWLEEMIRQLCVDDAGHPLDVVARSTLRFANVIAEGLDFLVPGPPGADGSLGSAGAVMLTCTWEACDLIVAAS